jgi:hypothetical protein
MEWCILAENLLKIPLQLEIAMRDRVEWQRALLGNITFSFS